jgi:hypothetical protein
MTSSTGNGTTTGTTDIVEIGQEMWSYLTGKGASVEYQFENMLVEVPKTTGPDSPRAIWRLDGTLRVKTSDQDSSGSAGHA